MMGYYVHIHVVFACDRNEGVAALAAKHLSGLSPDRREQREARDFLKDLSERTGANPGPKGGLSLWGMVGDYTNGQAFVDALMPFWDDLLTRRGEDYDGPLWFEHVLVFVENEGSHRMGVFEIFREKEGAPVEVRSHDDLPFCAYQM